MNKILLIFFLFGYCSLFSQTYCAKKDYRSIENDQYFVVPKDVTRIKIKAWGAGGGLEVYSTLVDSAEYWFSGGAGGYTEAELNVNQFDTLSVMVGRGGANLVDTYGFGAYDNGDGGGGGLTGVFSGSNEITDTSHSRALVIAGGGGGAGTGERDQYSSGTFWRSSNSGGSGNSPNSGGMPTMTGRGDKDCPQEWYTGTGGGGYYGGERHELQRPDDGIYPSYADWVNKTNLIRTLTECWGDAGQGGSGFVTTAATSSSIQYSSEYSPIPPNTTDTDYKTGVGQGGEWTLQFGNRAARIGGDGLIVIEWDTCTVENAPQFCMDGIDNDGDGLIDCDDPECLGLTQYDADGDGNWDECVEPACLFTHKMYLNLSIIAGTASVTNFNINGEQMFFDNLRNGMYLNSTGVSVNNSNGWAKASTRQFLKEGEDGYMEFVIASGPNTIFHPSTFQSTVTGTGQAGGNGGLAYQWFQGRAQYYGPGAPGSGLVLSNFSFGDTFKIERVGASLMLYQNGTLIHTHQNYNSFVGSCDENDLATCTDGLDNNGDGLVDCADPNCSEFCIIPIAVSDVKEGTVGQCDTVLVSDNDIDDNTLLNVSFYDTSTYLLTDTITVLGEGVWRVIDDINVEFCPEVGFQDNPSSVTYNIEDTQGNKSNYADIYIRYSNDSCCKKGAQ